MPPKILNRDRPQSTQLISLHANLRGPISERTIETAILWNEAKVREGSQRG
jgi:hypothetical protein